VDEPILYEQPLNETARTCLRLESLFAQAKFHLNKNTYWHDNAAIASLIDLTAVLERPDFKTKLTQILMHYKETVAQHANDPSLNQEKLESLIRDLLENIDYLQTTPGKLTQEIDKVEFLSTVRLRSTKIGGMCNFELPIYNYWLHQPEEQRQQDLQCWFATFKSIERAVTLLISLIRRSGQFTTVIATKGYYEQSLDPQINYQMIRIRTLGNAIAFPDVSVGRHRLSVHFFELNVEERPLQYKENFSFEIACCR
jgi:cell division protein ZapD